MRRGDRENVTQDERREFFSEELAAVRINFTLKEAFEARPFEPNVEAADSCEE